MIVVLRFACVVPRTSAVTVFWLTSCPMTTSWPFIALVATLPAPQLSLQLLAGRSAHHTTAGLLADALHLLAEELEDAPQEARHDLRTKLLLLSTDVASRVGSKSGLVTADLGDLLVAVAVAAEGLQPRTLKLLGKTSNSSRMSMHDIQV